MTREGLPKAEDLMSNIEKIFSNRKPAEVGRYRHFSVIVPIVKIEGEPHLLYEIRSNNIKRQPGEICFPGGMCEGEETYLECALRETCEEIGVADSDIKIISEIDKVMNYSGFTIHCYLGEISQNGYEGIHISQDEVKEIFTLPIKWLLENEPMVYSVDIRPEIAPDFPYEKLGVEQNYHWRVGRMDVPIYDYEGKMIWGITGRITHNFIKIIKQNFEG